MSVEIKNSAWLEWAAVADELRAELVAMSPGTAAAPGLPFTNDANTGLFRPAANVLAVSTNGAERVRVGANGISFDGGSNFLGDYEDGSWTPAYAADTGSFDTLTYDRQVGRYVRVGRLVHVSGQISTSEVVLGTASGRLRLSGLPFPFLNVTNYIPSVRVYARGFASAFAPTATGSPGASTVRFDNAQSDDTVSSFVSVSVLTTGAVAFRNVTRFAFSYFV